MKEAFIQKKFYGGSIKIIEAANKIIHEYQVQGLTLTLRQLYYQFVSRDMIPNTMKDYKRLGSVIDDARLAGLIDWSAIEDRTRNFQGRGHHDNSPEEAIDGAAQGYSINPWISQIWRPEVWIEKEALVGVIQKVCHRLWIPYFACRGYNSQSEQYKAGKRHEEYRSQGLHPVVLHLGDHDPSGMDMTRDNRDRLTMFARHGMEVRRLALNYDQVEEYSPPPNPAKETDSRAAGYMAEFGESSWELDALEPTVIGKLISDQVEEMINQEAWDGVVSRQRTGRAELRDISANFANIQRIMPHMDDVLEFLDSLE